MLDFIVGLCNDNVYTGNALITSGIPLQVHCFCFLLFVLCFFRFTMDKLR